MLRGQRSWRDQEEPEGFDLSPMIDIVFNLLVFFICATKFRTAEGAIQTYLPKDQGLNAVCRLQLEVQDVRIRLLAQGEEVQLWLGQVRISQPGELVRGREVASSPAWARLHERLLEVLTERRAARPLEVILDVRPEVPHQCAVSALNEVVRAGVQDVRFAAPELPY